METIQYTIRGVPARVDALLRQRAKSEEKSLNTTALEVLSYGLGLAEQKPEYHDMDDLIGTWVQDDDFDAAVESMDRIDEELWQ